MWNYDAAQSGKAPTELPDTLHLQWKREFAPPQRAWPQQFDDRDKLEFDLSYAPVVMGESIFVPSMVADRVTAYRIGDGTEIWRHYADGPVRLAPAAWNGKVYFVSDDGCLYCVNAETGERIWRFRAAPSARLTLGNNRVISMWAARGAPVIADGIVYFAAGVWPFMGTFVYALDAESGQVIWENTGDSATWQRQPHGGAYSFAGIAPQGYLAVRGDRLVVSGGRSTPALLDRHTGEILHLDVFGKGPGGYRVTTDEEYYYNHGTRYRLLDGRSAGEGDLPNATLQARAAELQDALDGDVFALLAARQRLFVTTSRGSLYCFGPTAPQAPQIHALAPSAQRLEDPRAEALADQVKRGGGYALFVGAGDGERMLQLALRTRLHIVCLDTDETRIAALRRRLDDAGLYGTRIALLPGCPATVAYPPYISSLIVAEDFGEGPSLDPEDAMALLRPYGGAAWIGDEVLIREGPLPGAGQWTHQYADAARTAVSRDERVRLPLGVLWYGTVSHNHVLPRHAAGPRPQIAGGRLIILGVETISARDVFTGRELWLREFPGIGHPFTNLELETRWEDGESVYMSNIPGAAYIGSPYVSLPDSIYLRHAGRVHRLDPDTGDTLAQFALYPEDAQIDQTEWGYISAWKNLLIATTGPHDFDETRLGWVKSWNATSSRHLHVMDRFSGERLWSLNAVVGFRHNAIAAAAGRLYVIDGLSPEALDFLARRGAVPEAPSRILALDASDGRLLWENDSNVFGTYLAYSEQHDILLESGSRDTRSALPDEPGLAVARRGSDGDVLWEARVQFPAAILDERLIPARPGNAVNLLTGETMVKAHPLTGEIVPDDYRKFYGCSTMSASPHLLLFRSGAAGYADLERDGGTGNFGGFKSGCTANMIAADGILNAPDYTRTCQCSYQNQTSLGLTHMPEADIWTSVWAGRGSGPIRQVGINLGAPGNRRTANGTLWVPFPPVGAPTPDLDIRVNTVRFGDPPVRVTTASASAGDAPGNTLDDNAATVWEIRCNRRGRFGHWIRYDLSEPVRLDRVEVSWTGPTATQFRVEISTDADSWIPVVSGESSGPGRVAAAYRFDPVQAQHVRLTFGDHGDESEDSRGRRIQQRVRVNRVRIGDLADPDAYAYFMPKTQFRMHTLEVANAAEHGWVAASGLRDVRYLELAGMDGGHEPYTVTLHFLEPDHTGPGERVFDIRVQGELREDAFDIAAQSTGPRHAVSRSFAGITIGPSLRIELAPLSQSRHAPVISGLEIVRE